ncbi:unnamed protein product [Parnassius mnemosyne]|uniref:RWD domain-containing protein n=1 Tax=Parnassius mnemosyne TaxID=213953 RepID=A0AAV1K5G2_9NEOP
MDVDNVQTVRDTLVNTLTKQLSEFDLLKSMYPSHGEIILSDCNVVEDIKSFVDNKSFSVPNHLDFVLNLNLDGLKLEVNVNLPSLYPDKQPDVYVRCNQLNRKQETCLNSDLSQYIKNVHQNEVCLYTVISWLQENFDSYKTKTEDGPQAQSTLEKQTEITFVRLWIFSHHIYNKYKREQIVKRSRDLKLTGFCLPGKPGIICIEGTNEDCLEWWKDIKTMNWKKISIRKMETLDINVRSKQQKFKDFQEISFNNSKSGLSSFIDEHNLSLEFSEFLGLKC